MNRAKMLERVKENEEVILNDDMDSMRREFYNFIEEFELSFDVDLSDCGADFYMYQTVYVQELIGENGYNIILDVDFNSYFDTAEEFVDYMISAEEHAQKVLNYFENKKGEDDD